MAHSLPFYSIQIQWLGLSIHQLAAAIMPLLPDSWVDSRNFGSLFLRAFEGYRFSLLKLLRRIKKLIIDSRGKDRCPVSPQIVPPPPPPPPLAVATTGEEEAGATIDEEDAYLLALEVKIEAASPALLHVKGIPPLPEGLRQRYRKPKNLLQAHPYRVIISHPHVYSVRSRLVFPNGLLPAQGTPPPSSSLPRWHDLLPGSTVTAASTVLPVSRRFSMPLPWSHPPQFPFDLEVWMPSLQEVCGALKWMQERTKDQDPVSVLGMDVETDDLCETQLLQLSTDSRAVLLRIPILMQPPTGDEALAAEGLHMLRRIINDDALLKCGCELRKDALDLLYDTNFQVRMRGGRDFSPALKRPQSYGHADGFVPVMGLVEAFNARHGTALVKDKNVTCSDWRAEELSTIQLKYAAMDAWMSFRLGMDKKLLQSRETCHIELSEGELSGDLREAGRLLREVQVVRDGCRIRIAHIFHNASWQQKTGVLPRLELCMAQYDSKIRKGDRVEVRFEGIVQPWLAFAVGVMGKTAILAVDQRPRYDVDGALLEQLDVKPLFNLSRHPSVKDITRVLTSDYTADLLMTLIKDLVGQSVNARCQSIDHSRFAAKYLLGGAHAAAPPYLLPPLPPLDGAPFQLNAEQATCINDVVAGNPISLTLGPPGTGKTTCIAAVAWHLAERCILSECPLVVITTQQNVAALNVLRALLRFGYQSVKLVVGQGYYIDWHEHEYTEAERKYIHVPAWPGKGNPNNNKKHRCLKNLPRLAEERKITILTLGYVASMAKSGSKKSDLMDGSRVGAVLVDEASQAWSAHALLLDQAFCNLQRLHLFGDDKQLPPALSPKDDSLLAVACNQTVRSMYDEARDGGKTYHALQMQYRMPMRLASFLSEHVYENILRSAPDMSSNDTDVLWLSMSSRHAYPPKSHSPINAAEARLIAKLVHHIDQLRQTDASWRQASCLVLTPYSAQRHLIELDCHNSSETRGGRWSIKTVDSFQGREADVVILSLTKTSGGLGFLQDLRRANVMLSRARKRLILVGNRSWFATSSSPLWRSLAVEFPVADSFSEVASMLGRHL